MSMTAALSNVGGGNMFFNRRQQARLQSERVASNEVIEEEEDPAPEEGSFINVSATTSTAEQPNDVDLEAGAQHDLTHTAEVEEEETESEEDEEEAEGVSRYAVRHTMSLADLEQDMVRRCQGQDAVGNESDCKA